MSRALVLVVVLLLSGGCSCALPAGLAAVGIAGAVVLHDPAHAVSPSLDLVACLAGPR